MTPWERAVRAHRLINDEAHGNDDTICESEACEFIVEEIEAAVDVEREACARAMCGLCASADPVPLAHGGRFHENAAGTVRRPCRASAIRARERR